MAVKKNAAPDEPGAEPPFEQALERLEQVAEDLESGQLSLEDSLARYEEGVKLSRRLTQTLDDAEKRIEKLEAGGSGAAPATSPMELDLKNNEPEAGGQLPF